MKLICYDPQKEWDFSAKLLRMTLTKAMLATAVLLGSLPFRAVAHAESFDRPLQQKVVDLGQSPELRAGVDSHIRLECFYYPTFVIRQMNDPGIKGTLWVTIAPVLKEHLSACRRSHDPTERFRFKDGWFFAGAKGSLLFFEASDGNDGGTPFRILDWKTGKKVFEDSVALPDLRFDFTYAPDSRISLRYKRVVRGDCSIPKDGMSCWSKFSKQLGLPLATKPKCVGYEGEEPVPHQDEDTESAITYPVAVELLPRPSIEAVSGPVTCRPVD